MNRRLFLVLLAAAAAFLTVPGTSAENECPGQISVVGYSVVGDTATVSVYNTGTTQVDFNVRVKAAFNGGAPIEFRVPVLIDPGKIVDISMKYPNANPVELLELQVCGVGDTLQEAPDPIEVSQNQRDPIP